MTLKEIKKYYRVMKMDGYYDLYTLEPQTSGRNVYKYLTTIYKINNTKFHIKGCEPTHKFKELQSQIKDYLNSLKYDSSYYSPSYRKGTGQDWFLLDLLYEYGFKRINYSDYFKYDVKSIYGTITTFIEIGYTVDADKEEVNILYLCGDSSWITLKSSFDFEEIHRTIDGLLKPLLLSEGVNNVKASEKMSNYKVDIVINELKGLTVTHTNVDLKAKLLELANSL